jgi:hypothetical protein
MEPVVVHLRCSTAGNVPLDYQSRTARRIACAARITDQGCKPGGAYRPSHHKLIGVAAGMNEKGKVMEPVTRICPTSKACFESEASALKFESENRPRNGEQRPYECEKCDYYHLTSRLEDSRNYAASPIYRTGPAIAGNVSPNVDKHEKIVSLFQSGVKMATICGQLDVPYHIVRELLIKRGLHTPSTNSQPISRIQSLGTLEEKEKQIQEQIAAQMAELQVKMRAIQEQKAAVVEATRLKISFGAKMLGDENCGLLDRNIILVQQHGNFLRLSPLDAEQLVSKLQQFLDEHAEDITSDREAA